MYIRLFPGVCELKRVDRIRTPEQDNVRNKATDLEEDSEIREGSDGQRKDFDIPPDSKQDSTMRSSPSKLGGRPPPTRFG